MVKLALLAFWASLLFAVVMAALPHAPELIDSDKAQHMLAFGTLTALAALAYPAAPLLRVAERLSFLGAMIEVVQSIPALHRDCDVMDWVADTSVILGVVAVIAARRRWSAAREEAFMPD